MAWYIVHVGHMPGIYRTWEDCYAQVNRYPGNLHKKYNTEAEALRAYYSHPAYLANHGQPDDYSRPSKLKLLCCTFCANY